MKSLRFLLLIGFFFAVGNLFSQTPQQVSLQINASVQNSPPSINLTWRYVTNTGSFTIYRKLKNQNSWGPVYATLPSTATHFLDNSVSINTSYEYKISVPISNSLNSVGYINCGIEIASQDNRGNIILVVDDRFQLTLQTEITRLIDDLEGDGYKVLLNYVSTSQTVASVKNIILQNYLQDPTNTKSVFLFGHVPIPYSGQILPDGHADHTGAWPADLFYGDVDGTCTDIYVNSTASGSSRNYNVPGDGKYDQSYIASDIELAVGRVDFFSMPTFSNTEAELLKNYLDKNHDYRTKVFSPIKRALVDDGFGYFGGEAFASSAFRSFSSLVGNSNITSADYFGSMTNGSYLWSYGCGGGTYTSANGIGTTSNFSTSNLQGVFTMLFGSYFGDWASSNNFLRAPLASGKFLCSVWSGRPYWMFHHMALGESIGYSTLISQNNNGLYLSNYGARLVHVGLMGDPTLKNDIVAPPSNLQASLSGTSCTLTWNPSSDAVLGYNVYLKNDSFPNFKKINSSIISGNTYSDPCLLYPGNYTYMVRAVKFEAGFAGTYYNLSKGIKASIYNPNSLFINSTVSNFVVDTLVTFSAITTNATNYFWNFGDGNTSNILNPTHIYLDGIYNVTFIASNQCNADTVSTILGVGFSVPTQPDPFSSFTDTLCAGTNSVIYSVPSAPGINYSWVYTGSGVTIIPSGANATINFSTNATSGELKVIPSNVFGNGMPRTIFITVNPVPNITITGNSTICLGDSVFLIANGASSYSWSNGSTENAIYVNPISTITYHVIGQSINGCSNTSSQLVTVVPVPTPPIISVISGQNPFCNNSSVTLRSSYTSGNLWSNGSQTRDVVLSETQNISISVTLNGCTSLPQEYSVSEKPPLIAQISGNSFTCELSSQLTAASNLQYPFPVSYRWIYPNSSIFLGQTQNANISGTYQMSVIPSDGCPSQSTSFSLTVSANTPPQISVNDSLSFCDGGSRILTSSFGGAYLWNTGQTTRSITVNSSGTFFVSVLSGGCTGVSDTVIINEIPNVNPNISINASTQIICNNDIVEFNVISDISEEQLFIQWKKNGINVGLNQMSYVDSSLLNGDFISCDVTILNGCYTQYQISTNSISVTVFNCGSVWTGLEDNNWSNPLNWSTLEIPTNLTSVTILPGALNLPELTTISYCNNLNLVGNVNVSLNEQKLIVYGEVRGDGVFLGNRNSELEFNSESNSGTIKFSQIDSSARSVGKLIVNTNSLFIGSNLDIYGSLVLIKGTLGFRDNVTLKSNANHTANIPKIDAPELCHVDGEIVVEKFILGGLTGWVGLGNPVFGAKIIDWQDDFATSGFPGSTGYAAGFISIYKYNEFISGTLDHGYFPPIDTAEIVRLGKGYMVFLGDGLVETNSIVCDSKGPISIGDFSINATYTSSIPFNLINDDGWNFVSNPYCSTIDWDSNDWIRDGINGAIYFYNPDLQSYATYVLGSNGFGINGGSNLISSNQAFWVKLKNNSSILKATEGIKVDDDATFFRSQKNQFLPPGKLKLSINYYGKKDETLIQFNDLATNNFDDDYDAIKFYSLKYGYPNLSTKINGINYAINSIPTNNDSLTEIPLSIKVSYLGNYALEFNSVQNFSNNFYLKNNLSGQIMAVNNDTIINLFVTDTLEIENKYSLVFGEANIQTSLNKEINNEVKIFPNPSKDFVTISLLNAKNVDHIEFVDNLGRSVLRSKWGFSNTETISTENLFSGMYQVKVFSKDGLLTIKKWTKQ